MLGKNEIKTLICFSIMVVGILIPMKLFISPILIWLSGAVTAIAFKSAKDS